VCVISHQYADDNQLHLAMPADNKTDGLHDFVAYTVYVNACTTEVRQNVLQFRR